MEQFIQNLSRKAGLYIIGQFGKKVRISEKANSDEIVTDVDLKANSIIIDAIKDTYPLHAILSEETGISQNKSDFTWIIDPLDGTVNFATQIPLYSVMIGLSYKGLIQMATIYNPNTDELFFSKKGEGTYLNNKRVYCSEKKEFENSYGLVSSRLSNKNANVRNRLSKFSKKKNFFANSVGSFGVSATYLANGRRDWIVSTSGKLWDYASPSLVLAESGYIITTIKGELWDLSKKNCLIANSNLHPVLLEILN